MENISAYKFEVLVASMSDDPVSLVKKMKLTSNFIIANQCNSTSVESYKENGLNSLIVNTKTKGVGINRNIAWMYSCADIVLFADDDLEYVDNYEKIIIKQFIENPRADIIVFNIEDEEVGRKKITKKHYTKKCGYGAVRIAMKREKALMYGIDFNLKFGGGTTFSCGEDTLFLRDCILNKMKILAVPITIAKLVYDRPSTWFNGYTEKYYYDRGVLLAACRFNFSFIRLVKHSIFDSTPGPLTKFEKFQSKYKGYKSYKKM